MKKFEGIIPPIVTPFKENGDIDKELIRREMRICMDAGADGLSVAGSTGEGPTLNDSELQELIRTAREFVSEDQAVVCGIMRTCSQSRIGGKGSRGRCDNGNSYCI